MREWSVEIWLLDDSGIEVPATCFEKAVYNLHPSFERNKQTFKKPPFRIQEKGWGEFEMQIVLSAVHKGGEHMVVHDLNFASERYEAKHTIVSVVLMFWGREWADGGGEINANKRQTFKNPRPELVSLLAETGAPGDANGVRGKNDAAKKNRKRDKNVSLLHYTLRNELFN